MIRQVSILPFVIVTLLALIVGGVTVSWIDARDRHALGIRQMQNSINRGAKFDRYVCTPAQAEAGDCLPLLK